MRRSIFLAIATAPLLLTPAYATAQYVTTQQDRSKQNITSRPRMQSEGAAKIRDELARVGDEYVILRSGENVPMPLTRGAVLRLGLDSHVSTDKLREGANFIRILEVRAPLHSPFNAIYADKETSVETAFSGRSSGFKNRAMLLISPMQFQIEVGPTDYKVIDTLNGVYVALKPGKWRFELNCSLTQVVSPDGEMWTASAHSETDAIVGKRFGREGREQFYPNPLSPISSIRHLDVVYPLIELKDFFKMVIHRPNILIRSESDMYFYVNKMSGTYLGPSVPTGPATIVR